VALLFGPHFEGENGMSHQRRDTPTVSFFRLRALRENSLRQLRKELIIHTDICGHFPIISLDGFDSCITFIDDFSCWGHIYPICDQSKSFKIYKAKVENQHIVKIKVVRLGQGDEYYGRHALYG